MTPTTLCVAPIQPLYRPGQISANLEHLETLIAEAASSGTQPAPLPEHFPELLRLDEAAWRAELARRALREDVR